jgi:vacuolar-type H+-ATPase subunit H
MGPQSDVEKIKDIYRAEREADRIVREAEDAARTLLEEAAAASGGTLAAKRTEFARRSGEALEKATAEVEREAQALLESARLRTEAWVRRTEPEIDSIADALLERILPP